MVVAGVDGVDEQSSWGGHGASWRSCPACRWTNVLPDCRGTSARRRRGPGAKRRVRNDLHAVRRRTRVSPITRHGSRPQRKAPCTQRDTRWQVVVAGVDGVDEQSSWGGHGASWRSCPACRWTNVLPDCRGTSARRRRGPGAKRRVRNDLHAVRRRTRVSPIAPERVCPRLRLTRCKTPNACVPDLRLGDPSPACPALGPRWNRRRPASPAPPVSPSATRHGAGFHDQDYFGAQSRGKQGSLCTLRSRGRPRTTQHSVPAGWPTLAGQVFHLLGRNGGPDMSLHGFPLHQALPGAGRGRPRTNCAVSAVSARPPVPGRWRSGRVGRTG